MCSIAVDFCEWKEKQEEHSYRRKQNVKKTGEDDTVFLDVWVLVGGETEIV
jgi:hypothetical protein